MKKKIGLLALALVLALGGLGIGYASWSDTVTVTGTVNTGTVDLVVEDISGTDVYKLEDGTIYRDHWYNVRPAPPANSLLVAWAIAEKTGDDEVTVTFQNLFPSIDFIANFEMHYNGSIPTHITVTQVVSGIPASWVTVSQGWPSYTGAAIPVPWQVHFCDMIGIYILIHVPQGVGNETMDQPGTVTLTFTATQWNEP